MFVQDIRSNYYRKGAPAATDRYKEGNMGIKDVMREISDKWKKLPKEEK